MLAVAGPTTVNIAPSGTAWALQISGANCGAGTFATLALTAGPAPAGGQVSVTVEADGGSTVMLSAAIGAGSTSASDAGSGTCVTNASAEAATGASNTVSLSGTVRFTRTSDGAVFNFVLQPMTI